VFAGDERRRGAPLSIRDPFYIQIDEALRTVRLDTDLFERLAAELVESKGFGTNLAVGGADNGYDFELLDTALEPGPGVVTTSDGVTTNLKRNLDRNKASCPRAAKKTYVVTSSVLTSRKRDNLKRAARERGYTYLGASDRHEVARFIYANPRWAKDLLGLTGRPSALSVVPRSSRPLVDIPLVGRENAAERLRGLGGDALLVGSPGSGKTALLSRLVADGMGSFMVTEDMTAVANAIRQQQPRVVIVDDLEDTLAATRDLVQLRRDVDAHFRIVVTDWETNRVLQQTLGLTDMDIITLERLTRDEIVSVVKSAGVIGPRLLVREIVDQAEGVPGLAVTLTQAALAGDYGNLFDGNRLGSLMESTVSRLLGNPREGSRAVLALGAISLAGDPGLTLEEIAEYVGVSKTDLQHLLVRLTPGGIIRSDRRRVSLRPRPLRRYMIRKAFFSVGAADHAPLLAIVPDSGEAAKELVLASCAGAAVPNLLNVVLASGSTIAARYYAGSGEREAREILAAAPALAIYLAPEVLHNAPESIIPLLLEFAVADLRELHNTPEQPLRIIKDWANSGVPGRGDAVARKRSVVWSALRWAADGKDFDIACRVCAEVLRTVFEVHETDPGAGMTFHMVRGMLTDEEVAEVGQVWRELRTAIEKARTAHWPSLLHACWDLIHPHVFGDHPDEVFQESRRLGETVIRDLGDLAATHPGVLDRLNTMRRQLGHDDLYVVPKDYVVLFGEHELSDWRREEQERATLLTELADKSATGDPSEFASRLRWLHEEAGVAGKDYFDRSPQLCSLVAQRVNDAGCWLAILANARVPSACILPFLERTVEGDAKNWESVALSILDDPELEQAGVDVALRTPYVTDTIWSALSARLARHHHIIRILCLRHQVPLATLRRLLQHESSEVTHATAVGMWSREAPGAIPDDLRQEWEGAVVGIDSDEYWLETMLASSPAMAARWLKARIEHRDWRALWNRKTVQASVAGLDDAQRFEMLRSLPSHFLQDEVLTALIGDSDELYRRVLRDESLGAHWKAPLHRTADATWRRLAGIALAEGQPPREVAVASMLRSGSFGGLYSAHLQGQIKEFECWREDPEERIREVARLVIEWLSTDRQRTLAKEHEEAIEGLG
jgi:hypothetical protein